MKSLLCGVLFILTLVGAGSRAGAYDYPVRDPYLATIIGTPTEFQPSLPKEIDYELLSFKVFPERVVPEVFWYHPEFRYSLTYQKGEAPLVFVIAGTGASFHSSNMIFLQRVLYQAGFHVICLSSPTSMNFIATASQTSLPGNILEDARDLYRVMTLAWEQVRGRIRVSEFHLTGYSLGASEAAFIARLDDEKRIFNFRKVLLINPAVSLYTSAKILDDMLLAALPDGMDDFNAWVQRVLDRFAEFYRTMGYLDLSHDYLYEVYRTIYRTGPPRREDLATMIGTAFRFSSQNMIFTSDVMTNAGFIVPKNRVLGSADSLTDYFKIVAQTTFIDYFNELLFPYFKSRHPQLTPEKAIDIDSLRHIEGYLRSTPKIGLMGNEDDLILSPEDLAFLKDVFGARAKIYPFGGHCGNMGYWENVQDMIRFFRG